MRDRDAAGLLGVVLKVALREVLGVVADDLDGVLVRAHGAVRPESPEHALLAVAFRHHKRIVAENVAARDVIDDAHAEVVHRLLLRHVREDVRAHLRREVLRTDAIAAGEDLRILERDHAVLQTLPDRRRDVEVQRIADRARLLHAVEDRDDLDRRRKRLDEIDHRERTVQVHLEKTDLLALLDERVNRLVERVAARAHRDHHVLRVGGADVVVELVRAARELREAIHVLLDDRRRRIVELVADFAELERDVRVRRRAAHRRVLRIERALAEVLHILLVDHLADHVRRDLVDLLDLVRGAETVEEVKERNLRGERRGVRDHRHVVRLLHGVRAEHRETGLAARHHVTVVAEDAQRVGRERAGGNMEHGRGEFASDLVHIRDHQQETLRRRKGRRKRTRGKRTVDRTSSATLGFHLHDGRDGTPDVRLAHRGKFVARFRHRR